MKDKFFPRLKDLLGELFDQIFPEKERGLEDICVSPREFLVRAKPYLNEENLNKLREKAEEVALVHESLPGWNSPAYEYWFDELYNILKGEEIEKVV